MHLGEHKWSGDDVAWKLLKIHYVVVVVIVVKRKKFPTAAGERAGGSEVLLMSFSAKIEWNEFEALPKFNSHVGDAHRPQGKLLYRRPTSPTLELLNWKADKKKWKDARRVKKQLLRRWRNWHTTEDILAISGSLLNKFVVVWD